MRGFGVPGNPRGLLMLGAVLVFGAMATWPAAARADGSPNISAMVSSSATLYGDPVDVRVTASNPGSEPYGYNLSYRVVLPEGLSYAGGAAVAPQQIPDQPSSGETTLTFSNVSDLSPNSTRELDFQLSYSQTSMTPATPSPSPPRPSSTPIPASSPNSTPKGNRAAASPASRCRSPARRR